MYRFSHWVHIYSVIIFFDSDDDQDETQDVTVNDPEYLRILEQLVQTRNQKLEKIQHWRECELEVIQKWQDFQTKQAWDEFKVRMLQWNSFIPVDRWLGSFQYAIETSREARIRKVKEKINKLQQEFNELKETV